MSEWKEYRLYDLADKIAMGPFGSNIKVETFKESGIPIISGMHLHGIRLLDKDFNYISEEHAKRLSNSNVYRHDVIFTHAGTIGQVAYIPETSKFERYIISQRQFYLRCNPNKLDYKYITYFFKSPYGQFLIDSNTNQTGVPSIAQPATFLKNVDILLPPLPEQKAIAGVLSSLDDKIDLLHRQNKTLEAMAEVLFRQWFVEEMDWDGTLSEYVKVQGGYAFKSSDFKEAGSNGIIKITNISMGSIDIDRTQFVDDVIVNNLDRIKFKINTGDFLIAMTGAEIGKIGIVEKTKKSIWVNQRVGRLIPMVPYGEYIGYLALKSPEGQDHIINACSGSAQENISSSKLEEMRFFPYSTEKTESFGEEVRILFEKIVFNQSQIRTIEKLRDTLLPKLMSGEVRVKV